MKTRICQRNLKHFGLLVLTSLLVLLFFITKCDASQVLEFTLEPSDTVVPEGSSVLLQCAGKTSKKISHSKDEKLIPNIRWRGPDRQDIGIDTFITQLKNGSLYISSVNENRGLTGNYQCLLSVDGLGTIVSRTARLSIASQPEVNQESNEVYLDLGNIAYIKCMTSQTLMNINDKNFKVQWFKDDVPFKIDSTRMSILPTASLEIDEITFDDRGTYQCNVSYESYSRASSKTNLNVKSPSGNPVAFAAPSFVIRPVTQTVKEGEQVILECAANGNPKPKVIWLRNGIDIDFNDLDSRFRMIGTGSLQIASVEDNDSGDYQCRASNSVDSMDAIATLNVQIPPKFVQEPQDKVANEKDELELACLIYGKPTPTIQWLKNGDLITPNDYMQISGGHNLKILGLISSDSGMFQCIGTNSAGSVQASAYLEVLQIGSKKQKNKKFTSTTSTTTKKPTKPDLKSMIKISKNSNEPDSLLQKSSSNKNLSKQALDSLLSRNKNSQFSPSKFQDSNDYLERLNDNQQSDVVDDEYDDDEEGSIHPIDIDTDPNKLLHALTNPNRNHDSDISHFSNSQMKIVTRKPPFLQTVEDNKHISVPLPGPPRAVQAQIIKPRFVTLNWLEPVKNPDEVVSYTVYYKMNAPDARERKIKTNSRDEQEANIQSLLPGKTYHFRVVANSNHGPGESSEILEISTQSEENMAGPPENFKGAAFSHDEIFLQWDPPHETNGLISNYRVYFAEGENGEDQFYDTKSNEFMLTQLRSYCEYTISVVAFNQNGMGNPSQEILVKTFSNTPSEEPSNITVEATSSTSISIRWEAPPPEHRNGPITGYKMKYRKVKKSGIQTETTPGNVRFYELTNLEKMSAYQIKIAAMTINGTGPFSDWINVETYANDLDETQVPGEPGWIRTKPAANSIIVSWGPPVQQDVKVRAYILGWGKGIPDEATHELDENSRAFEIRDLEANSEYVIALRARNNVGDGPPKYDTTRTREDLINEPSQPLEVPVGLRAIPMSGSTIVVYWTDTTLGKSQHVTDNRYYTVRYSSTGSTRYRYHNTTDLNCMILELKPNTQYEFEVKVVKGRRESSWSMSVLNTTLPASPALPPRDLKVTLLDDKSPLSVHLSWTPPKHSQPITNYVILYTTDSEKRDREWSYENVPTDKTSVIINQLTPHTTYFFKVQSKHGKILGPFSAMVSVRTGAQAMISNEAIPASNILLTTEIFYALIGGIILLIFIIVVVVAMIFCRRKPQETPEHKKSYQKNQAGQIKPPDLWIHHDQMELKNIEKTTLHPTTPGCSDGASSSGAMTLPRSVGHDFETDTQFPAHVTNSLDKRTYVAGYMTNSMSSSASDRPQYPRTQYNIQRPPHISTMDPSLSQQNIQGGSIIHSPENPYAYDIVPPNYSNPNMAFPGIPVEVAKHRGHPLKSFSIPAPPSNTPLIPNSKPVTIRPQNSSPYKKSATTTPSSSNRLQTGLLVPHSSDEIQALRPSTSTEELNQEMANLEGLMKDLSAITASEFEC
ncbi:hypothetical protein ACKWTF_002648 [Chironomus riparius]